MALELRRTFQVIFFILTYSFIQGQFIATSYPQLLFDAPKSVSILEGSVLWLYCKINSTSFTAEMTWRKNGITLTQDAPHIILRESSSSSSITLLLVIDNVVASDAGLYQCTAQDRPHYVNGDTLSINVSSGGALNGIVNPRILYEESHSMIQFNRTNAADEEVNLYLQLARNYTNELSNISVVWLQNRQRQTEMSLDSAERNNGNLILSFSFIFNNSKAGVYQCLIYKNNGTEVYSTYPLRLDAGTTPTVKRLSPPVVFLTPPEKLVLEFMSSGRFGYLIWHRDDQALASDSAAPADITEFTNFYEVFVREPTTNTDIGDYEVSISGTARGIQDTVMVSERRWPITTVPVQHFSSIKVREGEGVNISCMSTGAPTPTITWTLNNGSTNFSQTDTSSSNQTVTFDHPGQVVSVLHIEQPNYPQHHGLYECTGRNYLGIAFQSTVNIMVEVLVTPQVEVAASATILAAGQDLYLTCTVTRGNPLPNSYTWIYLGSNGEINSVVSYSSTFTKQSAQPDESGLYKCTAINEAGSGSDLLLVTIHDAPDISPIVSSTNDFRVPVGSDIELYCVVEDDNLTVNFTWQDPMGLTISLASVNETTASIVIMATGSEDFGVYICLADNGFGTRNRTVTISQGISPPIIDSPTVNVFEVISPARLNLSCSSLGYPLPEITWVQTFPDGFQIELYDDNSTTGQIIHMVNDVEVVSEYTIAATDLQDSANYTCIVTNLYGNVSNTYTVHVYLPPPNLAASVLSTTTISLTWPIIEIDTNTIWCEIQIYDSSFSGSNSSRFNLSDIEVDRNSWTLILNQLQPNTAYNISIRYLYKSTGNYASLMSVPIQVTTYSSVQFRVFFDLPCSTWKNSSLLSNSAIWNALIVKIRQLCECVWESESIISNGTLYCSHDSQPTVIYEANFQGTISEVLNLKLYLARLIDSESNLTISNYTLKISKCHGIFSNQSEYQCTASTNTTIATVITTTIFFQLRYWNPLSPFLICGGICVALAMVVVGMIIYSKGYCNNKKSSKQNITTEEEVEIQKLSKESQSKEAQDSSTYQQPDSHIYDIASTNQRESAFILSPCDAYVKHQEKVLEMDEDLYAEVRH